LTKSKRLGRYHNHNLYTNNNDGNLSSPSYFNELASSYKENDRNGLLNWEKPLFGNKHTSLQKLLASANKTIEKSTKFLNKIKSRQLAWSNRAKSIPGNATIRKEYVKCGKQMCELKHGPYYYAYWKDPQSKKLKKKYIGDHMPKDKESNDNSTNNQAL
jgi:hypothetical protein